MSHDVRKDPRQYADAVLDADGNLVGFKPFLVEDWANLTVVRGLSRFNAIGYELRSSNHFPTSLRRALDVALRAWVKEAGENADWVPDTPSLVPSETAVDSVS